MYAPAWLSVSLLLPVWWLSRVAVRHALDSASVREGALVRTPEAVVAGADQAVALWMLGVLLLLLGDLVGRVRRGGEDRDVATPALLPALVALTGLGMVVQLGYGDPLHVPVWTADRQGLGVLVGGALGGLLLALPVPPVERWTAGVRAALVAAAAGLVVALRFGPVAGRPVAGQWINLNLAGVSVQPLEVVKALFAVWLALELAPRATRLVHHRVRIGGVHWPRLDLLIGSTLGLLVVLGGSLWVRDLGMMLIVGVMFVVVVYAATGARGWFALAGALVACAAWGVVARPEWVGGFVPDRVRMWRDPWTNGMPNGDQLAEALWALALGGLTGRGPGVTEVGGLRAGHTDLALAALGEQLGWIGTAAYVVLLAVIVGTAWFVAAHARTPARSLVAASLGALLAAQALVIFAGTVGWLPLTGVVVPFVSRGMSALVVHVLVVATLRWLASDGAARSHSVEQAVFVRTLGELAVLGVVLVVVAVGQLGLAGVVNASDVLTRPAVVQQGDGKLTLRYARAMQRARGEAVRAPIVDREGRVLRATGDDGEVVRAEGVGSLLGPDTSEGDAILRAPWMLERVHDVALRGYGSAGVVSLVVARDAQGRERLVRVAGDVEVVPQPGERVRRVDVPELDALVPVARASVGARPARVAAAARAVTSRALALSIDVELQSATVEVLSRHLGPVGAAAAAVVDVDSGRLLAVAQVPDLDVAQRTWVDDAGDRGVRGLYGAWRQLSGPADGVRQLGSPGKLVTALARLRTSVVRVAGDGADRTGGPAYACMWFGARTGALLPGWPAPIRDHAAGPVGPLELPAALEDSRNCWFAQEAVALGPQPFLDLVRDGVRIGVGGVFEPGPAGSRQLGLTGIGQGAMAMDVRDAARFTAALGAGGVYRVCPLELSEACDETPLLPDATGLGLVLAGMRRVMTDGTGVGATRAVPVPGVRVYGKSGTADDPLQPGEAVYGLDPTAPPPHAWFVALAEPDTGAAADVHHTGRLAVAVLVFRGGFGARTAGPAALEIVRVARELGWVGTSLASASGVP